MTPLLTRIAFLTTTGMLVAAAAMAGPPSAATSTSPRFLRLVATTLAFVPDSVNGKFVVTVNDAAHVPIAGSNVTVDFSGCTADLQLGSNQYNANYTVDCTAHTVSAYTNSEGRVAFTILGCSVGPIPAGGLTSPPNCARVYADGVELSSPNVATIDLDGHNGASPPDAGIIIVDIATHQFRPRSDVDGNLTLSAGDLSLELQSFFHGLSKLSVLAACP